MRPIFLIGYMGCGKTTLGKALQKASKLQFIDLDNYIEARYRMNIRDIFTIKGADVFRDMEQRMLHEIGEFEDVIIACGGGTPCFYDNMEYMNSHGTTVWLKASHERLLDRLIKGSYKRPLLHGKSPEEIDTIIKEALIVREPFYYRASVVFPSDLLEDSQQISYTVNQFMKVMKLENIQSV